MFLKFLWGENLGRNPAIDKPSCLTWVIWRGRFGDLEVTQMSKSPFYDRPTSVVSRVSAAFFWGSDIPWFDLTKIIVSSDKWALFYELFYQLFNLKGACEHFRCCFQWYIDAKNIASFGGAGLKQLIRRNSIGFSMILPKLWCDFVRKGFCPSLSPKSLKRRKTNSGSFAYCSGHLFAARHSSNSPPPGLRLKEHADLLASLEAAGTFSVEDVELLGRRFHSLEELRGTYERCPKGEIFGFSFFWWGGWDLFLTFKPQGSLWEDLGGSGNAGLCYGVTVEWFFLEITVLGWQYNDPERGVYLFAYQPPKSFKLDP